MKHTIITLLLFLSFSFGARDTVHIGIVSEILPTGELQNIDAILAHEIEEILGNDRSVTFTQLLTIPHNSSDKVIEQAADTVLKEADIILAAGVSVLDYFAQQKDLSIPVIGLGVFDPALQKLPLTPQGSSGKKNFTYIQMFHPLSVQLREAHQIIPFKQLTIIYTDQHKAAFSNTLYLDSITADLGFKYSLLNATDTTALTKIPQNSDAVFVAMQINADSIWAHAISQYLIQKKLPSFSSSKEGVDAGLMAALSDTRSITLFARNVALLIEDHVNAIPLSEQPVLIEPKEQLYINLRTCRSIEFFPDFEVMFRAHIYEETPNSSSWTLKKVVALFLENNLALKSSALNTQIADQEKQEAFGNYLPDIQAGVTGVQIDDHRAGASASEKTVKGSVTLTQVIYSDKVIAGIEINKWLAEASKETEKRERLDQLYSLFHSYFTILKAQVLTEIQKKNLAVTKQNLELAQKKAALGEGGMADVYRYESQAANDFQSIIVAKTNLIAAIMNLAQILNLSQADAYQLEYIHFQNSEFDNLNFNVMAEFIRNPLHLKTFTEFLVKESHDNAPLIKELDYNLKAVQRQRSMHARSLYLPTVALQTQFDRVLHRDGVGSTPTPFFPGVPAQDFEDNSWSVGISLNYPIFEGTKRVTALSKSTLQYKSLTYQKKNVKSQIELSVRSGVLQMIQAATALAYSKTAATSAEKSFSIVQDSYKKGMVTIIRLLDGQKAVQQTELAYQNSIYDYILAFLQIEYRIGTFYSLGSQKDKLDFIKRAHAYVHNTGTKK